jgi:hypothetical protein
LYSICQLFFYRGVDKINKNPRTLSIFTSMAIDLHEIAHFDVGALHRKEGNPERGVAAPGDPKRPNGGCQSRSRDCRKLSPELAAPSNDNRFRLWGDVGEIVVLKKHDMFY